MHRLDGTLDPIENTRFLNIYHNLIRKLSKQTQFTEMELSCILLVYHKFVLANGHKAKGMTKKQLLHLFLIFFKIYDFQIIERILANISHDLTNDIDPTTWVKMFAVFMSEDLDERMRFAFSIYNGNITNGVLNREVVTQAVQKFFMGDDEDEVNELRLDMVELIFKVFDLDKDGFISFEEYAHVVRQRPMLLEFLGQCFPSTNGLTVIAYCVNLWKKIQIGAVVDVEK